MASKPDPLSEAKPAVEAATKIGEEAASTIGNAAATYNEAFASTIKASQAYQAKLLEFFQTNLQANVQFAQKLASVKTPADFVQLSTSHARDRAEALSAQAKELAELGQEASRKAFAAFTPPRR
jgi:phasin family protein